MPEDLQLHLIESFSDVERFMTWLGNDREFLGLDTETEGLIWGKHRVRLVQFGDTRECWAIPFNRWGGVVQDVFRMYSGKYAIHNAKFDMGRLQAEGLILPPWRQVNDTYVMSFLHDNQEPSKKLKRLAKKYLGINSEQGEQALQKLFREQGWWWDTIPVDNQIYWEYGALDATLHSALASKLWETTKQYSDAYDLEMAAIKVLMKMEANGLALDVPYATATLERLRGEWDELVYEVEQPGKAVPHVYLKGEDIRINFKEDILQYFTSRGIPVPTKISKKSGKVSIDDDVLSKINHPTAERIRRARHMSSWINNYLVKLLEHQHNGRVHPHINPLGGDEKGMTGRMSCTDPALFTLEKTSVIRDCIMATEGSSLLSVDYRNEELRIIASLCSSKGMIEAFERDMDMHKNTASIMYGIPLDEVSAKQKTNAKRAMFTKAYGGREKTFAAYMGLTYDEGARYFQALSTLYPELDAYIEHQKQTIKMNKVDGYGHIFLSDGRRLNIPSSLSFTAVSYSSQGEGAIVLKKKLVALDAAGFGDYLRLPVHDEVIFEVPTIDFDEYRREAMEIMTCYDFTVPLTTDGSGPMERWGDEYREAAA